MQLDMSSPVPLYHQLQDILRAEIARKVYNVGGKLPSEHELCRTYGVTRPTVRQALEGLVREGLVHKHRGKGAFVTEPPLPIGLFSLTGTSDAFAAQKLKVETRVLSVERVPTCLLAEGSDPAGGWVKLERMRRVNGVPTFFEYTWIHASLVPNLERMDLNNRSLFHTLAEQFKLRVDGGRQRFSGTAAPLPVAQALNIKPGVPLLRVVRSMSLIQRLGSGNVITPTRANNALQVDLYVAQGPFVLEQNIPPQNSNVGGAIGVPETPVIVAQPLQVTAV
ncbi:MAG TPA: GntR family transcriptional regulator [Planctomycetota bacterium]|nr:GntR family transcriptional regulator [Planctomycetota bacterium]